MQKLREGYPLVMGNRFKGGIAPRRDAAAAPLSRQSGAELRRPAAVSAPASAISIAACAASTAARCAGLELRTTGMEFASEMVVKAALAGWRIAEVPTTLHPDGRGRPPHLRSWRDGWRHLRFLLLFSPRWLFLYPGLALLALGSLLTVALYIAPLRVGGAGLDIHSMLYASAGALLGMQLCLFALFARVSAQNAGLLPRHPGLERLLGALTLERGLLIGLAAVLCGVAWSAAAFWHWRETGFGALDPRVVMRDTIPATALMIGGMELMLASFLLSLLTWKSAR